MTWVLVTQAITLAGIAAACVFIALALRNLDKLRKSLKAWGEALDTREQAIRQRERMQRQRGDSIGMPEPPYPLVTPFKGGWAIPDYPEEEKKS